MNFYEFFIALCTLFIILVLGVAYIAAKFNLATNQKNSNNSVKKQEK